MSFKHPKPGIGDVGSYEIAAIPYLTSSLAIPASSSDPLEIKFPGVTKFVIVTNTLPGSSANVPLRVGFSENGVKGTVHNNYLVLNNSESFEAGYRVSSLFLLSDSSSTTSGSVCAGITNIEPGKITNNWSGSSGVG